MYVMVTLVKNAFLWGENENLLQVAAFAIFSDLDVENASVPSPDHA